MRGKKKNRDVLKTGKVKAPGNSWKDFQRLGAPFYETNYTGWRDLSGEAWSSLLREHPRFADHCAWRKLDGGDWCSLLEVQPQFAEHCAWKELDAAAQCDLLRAGVAEHCAWGKLSVSYVCGLLEELEWEIDDFDYSSFDLLGPILHEKMDGRLWGKLLQEYLEGSDNYPQLSDWCPWEKLDGEDWRGLLKKPDFREEQSDFSMLCPWCDPKENLVKVGEGEDWKLPLAIVQKPELMVQDDVRERFEALLELSQDGLHYKDSWKSSVVFLCDELIGCVNPWAFVLCYRPELAKYCTTFEKFNGNSRCLLLMLQPQFADRWSMAELENRESPCWANLNARAFRKAWDCLIEEQPQFAE